MTDETTSTIPAPPPGTFYAKVPDASLIPDLADLPANCAGVIVGADDSSTLITTPAGQPDVIELSGDATFTPNETAQPSVAPMSSHAVAALLAAAQPPVYE